MPVDKNNIEDNEITLKELIQKLQEWVSFLFKKWKIIVPIGILGAALGVAYSFIKKDLYVADLTFVLEDSKSSPLGSYAGIASQFGIDLGGSSGSGVFSGENIIEFLRSRLMIEKTLLTEVELGGEKISLMEFYLRNTEIGKLWRKKPELAKLNFPPQLDRSKSTVLQDSLLNVLYLRINLAHLVVSKPDKKLSFILVKCTSESPIFSKLFTERLVNEATSFYISTKLKRSKANVDKLQATSDSLELLLNRKSYSVAAAEDLNLNPARRSATVGTELAMRDKVVLQTMYGEVVKNLELSKMAMAQETPIIQIVDRPILPLKKERYGKLKGLLTGGILAGFLAVLWIVIRRMYRNIMDVPGN